MKAMKWVSNYVHSFFILPLFFLRYILIVFLLYARLSGRNGDWSSELGK